VRIRIGYVSDTGYVANLTYPCNGEHHILSPLCHDHIVCLLGTCADNGERMLVTQYMPNGSLYDRLHGHRHQSCVGAARAVEHPGDP
jgi:hypothetical protein